MVIGLCNPKITLPIAVTRYLPVQLYKMINMFTGN